MHDKARVLNVHIPVDPSSTHRIRLSCSFLLFVDLSFHIGSLYVSFAIAECCLADVAISVKPVPVLPIICNLLNCICSQGQCM
jgi:hypothetical protein